MLQYCYVAKISEVVIRKVKKESPKIARFAPLTRKDSDTYVVLILQSSMQGWYSTPLSTVFSSDVVSELTLLPEFLSVFSMLWHVGT